MRMHCFIALTKAWQLPEIFHLFELSDGNHRMVNIFFVCVLCAVFCWCVFSRQKQAEVASGSMKRSVSTIADQRVNGLWQEEKSPERIYRPRHKSYKAAG